MYLGLPRFQSLTLSPGLSPDMHPACPEPFGVPFGKPEYQNTRTNNPFPGLSPDKPEYADKQPAIVLRAQGYLLPPDFIVKQ